jgi:ligand-binding sensor domain-containing protein/DNA-binding CsgD family transcriptional regulator
LNQRFARYILLIALSGWFAFAQAQPPKLFFDYLTIEEGLSHNTVFSVLQDHLGYIWIGTQNGLNRYDGHELLVYRTNEMELSRNAFKGTNIISLFEDSKKNLWVGTKKEGINFRKYQGENFINLQLDPAFEALKGYHIAAFFEDQEGNIWISCLGNGILKYNPQDKTSQHFNQSNSNLSNDNVFDLVQDKNGTIWAATDGQGLNYLNTEGQFEQVHVTLTNNPNLSGYHKTLLFDENYLWIGTEGSGLYRMDIASRKFEHFTKDEGLASNIIRDLVKSQDGKIYIAADGGGLQVFDPTQNQFFTYNSQVDVQGSLNTNALYTLLEDKTGNIWIGTFNGGLNINKANKNSFEFYEPISRRDDELNHRSVLSITQTQDGKIWVGTDGGGLNWLDTENDRFANRPLKHNPSDNSSLSGNVVKTIFEDRDNQLWVGLFQNGLELFRAETGNFQHIGSPNSGTNSLRTSNIWSIDQRKDGKLWIGTVGYGLIVYDPQNNISQNYSPIADDEKSIAEINIMKVFMDKDDNVWLGLANNGLDRWDDQQEAFIHYQHDRENPSSLSNNEVRCIFQDSKDRIWIGTEGGGLNLWLGEGQFKRFTKVDGLIANSVMGVIEDDNGLLWISTFEGVSRFNPKEEAFDNFNFHTGQNNNQFNQDAILKGNDGKLYFGGINGLNAIRPELMKNETISSEILFTDFKVFNKSVEAGQLDEGRFILKKPIEYAERVYLNYADNSFSISFSAIDYTSPEDDVFEYMMEGFDQGWQQTMAGQNSITYTNLDPGTFAFKIRRNEEEAQLSIIVRPPFWKTIWFRTIVVLFLILGILWLVWFILQRREAKHKREILEAERKILTLKNEKLEAEVDAKNTKLMTTAIQMAHKNDVLNKIRQKLVDLPKENGTSLRPIIRSLDQELKGEDYWNEFNVYFNQVDQNFVQAMLDKHPGLTQNDLRICTLTRINLNTKEMASLLNISVRGVEKSRYRLKKRLELNAEDDLTEYILGFKS